jgi:hypothetical protein
MGLMQRPNGLRTIYDRKALAKQAAFVARVGSDSGRQGRDAIIKEKEIISVFERCLSDRFVCGIVANIVANV